MGMFDWVTYQPEPCWRCGEMLSKWQSKDGDCDLEEISYFVVQGFYDFCDKCGAWNEFKVIPLEVQVVRNEEEQKRRSHTDKRVLKS